MCLKIMCHCKLELHRYNETNHGCFLMSVWKYLRYNELNYGCLQMSVVIGDYWMFNWLNSRKRSWGAFVGVLVSLMVCSRDFGVRNGRYACESCLCGHSRWSLGIWLKFGFCCYVGVWFWFWCWLWLWWLVFYLISVVASISWCLY